jgi:hypothetical protein
MLTTTTEDCEQRVTETEMLEAIRTELLTDDRGGMTNECGFETGAEDALTDGADAITEESRFDTDDTTGAAFADDGDCIEECSFTTDEATDVGFACTDDW